MRYILAVLFVGVIYLVTWPVPVEPVAYDPPEPPDMEGVYAVNDSLSEVEFVSLPGGAIGPEDLAVMPGGAIYSADLDGRLYRIDGDVPELVAELEGRPLGLDAGPDGRLYIADSFNGIYA